MTSRLRLLQSLLFKLLIFLLPTQLGLHVWPSFSYIFGIRVDYLAPTIYITDLSLVLLIFTSLIINRDRWYSYLKKFKTYLFIFTTFSLLNIFISQHPDIAFIKWLKVYELILFIFVVSKLKINWTCDVFVPFSLSTIFFGLLAILQFIKQSSVGGLAYLLGERTFNISTLGISLFEIEGRQVLRMYSTFSHPNSLAGFALVTLILIVFTKVKDTYKDLLKKAAIIASSVSIIFSFSLAAYVTLGILLIASFFKSKLFVQIIFLLCIIFSVLLPVVSKALLDFHFSKEISERLWLNIAAGEVFSTHPVLGVGLNNFINFLPSSNIPRTIAWILQPVHNIFLLVLSETGILGLLLFSFLLFKTLSHSLKMGNWLIVISFLSILLTGMVDHYWLTLQQNQLLFALVIGLSFNKRAVYHFYSTV